MVAGSPGCARVAPVAWPGSHAPTPELFNHLALRADEPLYWTADGDGDSEPDPDELRTLLFYPDAREYVRDGETTPDLHEALRRMAASASDASDDPEHVRAARVLDGSELMLIDTDLRGSSEVDRVFVDRMLEIARRVDQLYGRQVGYDVTVAHPDPTIASMRRVFWSNDEGRTVGVYPWQMQDAEGAFCRDLARTSQLSDPYSVILAGPRSVPYSESYVDITSRVASELRAAADGLPDPGDDALATYLRAAAEGFATDAWPDVERAWAAMRGHSRWFVDLGPRSVRWDPCGRRRGYRFTFGRIVTTVSPERAELHARCDDLVRDAASLEPEGAGLAEPVDVAEMVEVVARAGDDRLYDRVVGGITRGARSVVFENVSEHPVLLRAEERVGRRLFTVETFPAAVPPGTGALLAVLHELAHRLGPPLRTAGLASSARAAWHAGEELKAQLMTLYLVDWLRSHAIIDDARTRALWAMGIVRALEAAADPTAGLGDAAFAGALLAGGGVRWDPTSRTADGSSDGALNADVALLRGEVQSLLRRVLAVLASGDLEGVQALLEARDGRVDEVLRLVESRLPRGSGGIVAVYAVTL